MAEPRKVEGDPQGEAMRTWAHRVLDELLDDMTRREFYGVVGMDLSAERGTLTSVVRRYEGRVKPPKA